MTLSKRLITYRQLHIEQLEKRQVLDVTIGKFTFAIQSLSSTAAPLIPIQLPSGEVRDGNVLAVHYERQPSDSPQFLAITSDAYVRQTTLGGGFFTSARHFTYFTSGDQVADDPVATSIRVVRVDSRGHAIIEADYVNADSVSQDKFTEHVEYDIAPPAATMAGMTMNITVTNESGRAVSPAGGGLHNALQEQWTPIRFSTMYVADNLTPIPSWYDNLDPTHKYVGINTDQSLLNDGYSQNGMILVSTHDTKRIVTEQRTVELAHGMPSISVPNYEWYQGLVLHGEHTTRVRSEHLYDPLRNQDLQVLSASGLVNDPRLLNVSATYDQNDPNLVDGDGVQVRVGMDEEVGTWPNGASQSLTVRLHTGTPNADAVGVFAPAGSSFFLKNSNSGGTADAVFGFGPANSGWQPITGDWDGDGVETAGLYSATNGAFFLRNSHAPGAADAAFFFGPANAGLIAVAGDWNGEGIDTIGLYDRRNGAFFLRNSNDSGFGDEAFFFGPGGVNWLPIPGNWDGSGGDTVGLYSPDNSAFFLRNVHAPGAADAAFFYGPAGAGWLPIAGDWNGDSSDTIGLFSQGSSTFFLRNSNSTGIGEIVFGYGPPGANWLPLSGDWNGPAGSPLLLDGTALVGGQQPALTGGDLQAIVDEALARWAVAGLTSAQMATLRGANIQVTDLPGRYLGVALDSTIYIDRDAAGRGWFVDATPAADEEFTGGISADADTYRHVDLLTVVSHELGHLLGLEDLDPLGHEADLMAETLATGHRRLPTESALDAVFADESW